MDNQMNSVVGIVESLSLAEVLSLVLSSGAIPHEIRQEEAGWVLMVSADFEAAARRELALFEQENEGWPPPAKEVVESRELAPHFPWVVFCMGYLMVFHGLTGPWQSGNPWFVKGAVSGTGVLADGEWWRLVTGLTLHSDSVHLVGNVLIGGFLLLFLSCNLGVGLSWLLSLLTGILGNGMNVLCKGAMHLSVGYSTSVFGIVGLLCGLEMKRGGTVREMFVPLGAGVSLLAMLGSQGERTDLGAHWWGLAFGVILGIGTAHWPGFRAWGGRQPVAAALFGVGCLLVAGCWIIAWTI